MQHPRREFRALALGILGIACFLLGVAATGFSQGQARGTRFDEISVERINIVEPDGRVRLVLANSARQAQTMVDGVVLAPGRSRPAGMIFFNEEGDEVGGLVFTGRKGDTGPQATGSLTFDQYKQDQTVALQYSEGGGRRRAGLAVIDRPTTSLAAYAPLVEKRRSAKTDEDVLPSIAKSRLSGNRARLECLWAKTGTALPHWRCRTLRAGSAFC